MLPTALRWSGACALGFLLGPAWAGEFDCLVEARQMVEIRSAVEGTLESVPVQRGQFVKKGQVLAVLQSGPEKAVLDLARARAGMDGFVKAAQSRLESAIKKEQRTQDLFDKNFVSSGALEEARTQRLLAENELQEAREKSIIAKLEAKRASEALGVRTIRSPFDGVVVERYQNPGEFATARIKDPILKLAQIDPLNVDVILPTTLYGRIKIGQVAEVTPEIPASTFSAKVVVVDRVIDAASGTFGVRLELNNSKHEIPAGAKCKVRFPD
jgi:RND family efflux transporter MFP subunit